MVEISMVNDEDWFCLPR